MAEKALNTLSTTSSTEQSDPCSPTTGHVSSLPRQGLHKHLEGRHVIMIALGGALGTGLLVGTYVHNTTPVINTD
jgi:amino acid permease